GGPPPRAGGGAGAGAGGRGALAGPRAAPRRDPWFVRAAEYPGVGSSLAHTQRLPIPPGETVVRRIVTVVADGRLERGEAAALVRKAVSQ
ncbi:DUF6807 family protein, partial [Streptomyces diastatochromogenes]|uniref:DUF6807 family protein n=1 Tax=Streptomyces diastatochromogenes TaxID=42236 RepID=UPI00364E7580